MAKLFSVVNNSIMIDAIPNANVS